MIYGYLSDTALAPFGQSNTNYNAYSSYGTGVGQVTERVISMLNADMSVTETVDEQQVTSTPSPGLIIDPRTANGNMRCQGLFKGETSDVTDVSELKAAGIMSIHYDAYWAKQDAINKQDSGNLIDKVTKTPELVRLFNVIETITLSHYYDNDNSKWIHRSKEILETFLYEYDYNSLGYGYIPNSLIIPSVDYDETRAAYVRNVRRASTSITDKIGTNSISCDKPVLFPSYIQFEYQFTELESSTIFTLYLDPASMLSQYPLTKITHVVLPLSPEELFERAFSGNHLTMLANTSKYISNRITKDVYKSDNIMSTVNYTGAQSVNVSYATPGTGDSVISTDILVTCTYKGRPPTANEMKAEIYKVLYEYLEGTGATEEEIEEQINDVFPNLVTTDTYIIVPFYNTRIRADITNTYAYCRDTLSVAFIDRVIRAVMNQSSKSSAYTTLITIPGYLMHGVAVAEVPTNDAGAPDEISAKGLDSNDFFNSYQPLSSQDKNWITLTSEAQELAVRLAAIVGAEINNTALPVNITYSPGTQNIANISCSFYVFSIGTATFSVMTKSSFLKLMQGLPE